MVARNAVMTRTFLASAPPPPTPPWLWQLTHDVSLKTGPRPSPPWLRGSLGIHSRKNSSRPEMPALSPVDFAFRESARLAGRGLAGGAAGRRQAQSQTEHQLPASRIHDGPHRTRCLRKRQTRRNSAAGNRGSIADGCQYITRRTNWNIRLHAREWEGSLWAVALSQGWIIQVGCVKLAQVQGVSAQAAFGAGHTLSKCKTFPGERRRTDAWACSTHPTFLDRIQETHA